MNEYTCPDHGPIHGLGVCWKDGCMYDARGPKGQVATKTRKPAEADREAVEASVTLPWSTLVSVNKRMGGKAGLTQKEYRDCRDAMATIIRATYDGAPHETEVAVTIELYPPNLRGDPHNLQKAILDALEHGGVYVDDKRVTEWHGSVIALDKDEPRAEVIVKKRGR